MNCHVLDVKKMEDIPELARKGKPINFWYGSCQPECITMHRHGS